MKFIPLGYRPNVSSTRHGSSNVSLQADTRGLPHLSWLERKNGHNEIHYSFWDGQQWTYHQHPVIGWTEEELVSSGNSLVLGIYECPFIVFSRSLPSGRSAISIASKEENGWLLDELEVDYDVKTVGLFKYDYSVQFSSSSSSSLMYTSISSDSSNSSESSSSSSNSSNSSSSSIDSSSSSSLIYTSISSDSSESSSSSSKSSSSSSSNSSNSSSSSIDSSSSSSTDDARMFIVTYDSENIFRIYSIRNSGWYLIGEKSMSISDISTLKYVVCGKYLGITWNTTDTIYYNFFDINQTIWKYSSAQSVLIEGLSSVGVEGFNSEDDGKLVFAIIIEKVDETQIYNMVVDTNGVTSYLGDDYIIESEPVLVTGNNDYVSSGYSDISICRDPITNIFSIVAFGGRLVKYILNGSWTKVYGSIEGISSGISPDILNIKSYNGTISLSFSNNSGDVYYFYENSNLDTFDTVYPYITVFNEQRLYITKYKDGKLTDGVKVPCTWWDRVGDILRESITRVNVIVNDGEDPLCYSSSSSSTSLSSPSSYSSLSSLSSLSEITSLSTDGDSLVSSSSLTSDFMPLCSVNLDSVGGDEGYFNVWDVSSQTIGSGFSLIIDNFTTYNKKDRLLIYVDGVTVYDSGCIATNDTGIISGVSVTIPIGTSEVGIRIVPNCEGTTETEWLLQLHCE